MYSCTISVRTEPLQSIHCSQLKWCYNFPFLSPNSIPSSKDVTGPISQTKKCLLRTALLKFPGQDLSTNLPATLAQINTKDWTRRLISIVNQSPYPPLPQLCFQGSSAHQTGRTAESSNILSCCRRICQSNIYTDFPCGTIRSSFSLLLICLYLGPFAASWICKAIQWLWNKQLC